MRPSHFAELVRRYREIDAKAPATLDRIVARWARLGELTIPAYLLVALAVTALGVLVVLAAVAMGRVGAGIWGGVMAVAGLLALGRIVRAWHRSRSFAPSSRSVRLGAPRLAALADDVAARLGVPAPAEIHWIDGFAAATRATPSLLPGGRRRIELVVGAPLLDALTTRQVEAVIAHELAHHLPGRMSWGWRLAAVARFFDGVFAAGSAGVSFVDWPLWRFWRWYGPRAGAVQAAIARSLEFAADAASAEIAGPGAAGDALQRIAMFGPAFDRLVRSQQARNARTPLAAAETLAAERALLRGPPGEREARTLAAALREAGDPLAEHPSISERIAHMRGRPRSAAELVPGGEVRAADELLVDDHGDAVPLVAWREEQEAERLGELHEAMRPFVTGADGAAEALGRLAGRTAADAHEEQFVLDWLETQAVLAEDEEALRAVARRAVALAPRSGPVLSQSATILLALDDPAGPDLAARARTAGYVPPGLLEALVQHHLRRGDPRAAEAVRQEHLRTADRAQDYTDWAERPPRPSELDESDLPASARAQIRAAIADLPRLRRAWLVRGRHPGVPEAPVHLLVVQERSRSFRLSTANDGATAAACAERLGVPGIPPLAILDHATISWRLRRRVRRLAPEPLFDRDRASTGAMAD